MAEKPDFVTNIGTNLERVAALIPELKKQNEGLASATENMMDTLRRVLIKALDQADTQALKLVKERAERLLAETQAALKDECS